MKALLLTGTPYTNVRRYYLGEFVKLILFLGGHTSCKQSLPADSHVIQGRLKGAVLSSSALLGLQVCPFKTILALMVVRLDFSDCVVKANQGKPEGHCWSQHPCFQLPEACTVNGFSLVVYFGILEGSGQFPDCLKFFRHLKLIKTSFRRWEWG